MPTRNRRKTLRDQEGVVSSNAALADLSISEEPSGRGPATIPNGPAGRGRRSTCVQDRVLRQRRQHCQRCDNRHLACILRLTSETLRALILGAVAFVSKPL